MTETLLGRLHQANHDPQVCNALLRQLEETLDGRELCFMEVCGTHTVSIFQSGLRSLLPANITHLSGPGCPVCVTHESEIALLLDLADQPDVILATFGDLLRVPGPGGQTLKHKRAAGSRVEIVYSPLDALKLAQANPEKQIIFPGIGFETTAPAIAGTILSAQKRNLQNFSVLGLHKLVMPALATLLDQPNSIDAFLLPGHVATITGMSPFQPLADDYHKPAVVAGFEPADILRALCIIARLHVDGTPGVTNAYPRAVAVDGNPQARKIVAGIFVTDEARWRGLGSIANSGLKVRDALYDAFQKFGLELPDTAPIAGCRCGQILKGQVQPPHCPLFGKACSPANPIGPCMVSTEGSCAAWFKYGAC